MLYFLPRGVDPLSRYARVGDRNGYPFLLRPLRGAVSVAVAAAIRGSHPEVGEPYGRLARSRGGDVLGELDDQPLGTADVDEPIDVRVVLDLADRVEPVVPQAVDD
ncbi:MAG: hypothetical protein M3315_13940, partial [Actinomycetota bacterium]|nr:hypothetical protein [Actinomycetota bacterium]